jgi:hypothetical protein
MKKLLRFAAIAVLGLSMTTGVVSAVDVNGSIDNSGRNAHNALSVESETDVDVDNDNDVDVKNFNLQVAASGEAEVKDNRTGGDASTGDASNDNWTATTVRIDNSGSSQAALDCACNGGSVSGSIDNSGRNAHNALSVESKTEIDVDNDNDVDVNNVNLQFAVSGDATVKDNRTGGSATTGDASNVNTTETTVEITN